MTPYSVFFFWTKSRGGTRLLRVVRPSRHTARYRRPTRRRVPRSAVRSESNPKELQLLSDLRARSILAAISPLEEQPMYDKPMLSLAQAQAAVAAMIADYN